jgi:hypothetical protein
VGGNIHASRAWKGENMNFVSYFVAPWFAKVLFFICLIYFAYQGIRDCFATLSLHSGLRLTAMSGKWLAMTGNGSQ